VVDQTWFALKPLYVARYGPRVWGGGERQLLMSGTVLSAWQLVNNIGLDPSEGEHIELDSPFPPENRPVYVGNLDMTKKAREESWPAVVELVGNILDAHANEKGVLLTPSNEMLEYIRKRLKPKHAQRLVVAYGEDREEKYRLHLQGKRPSVLAASGFWEGADLKDDAARFQIIPAAPRPMWQGQIAARAQKDPAWYRWMTWTKFLQGTGRAVRSEKDYAATYVFDRELRTELARPDSMIPKWFQKAVHLVD
jgi:Rad3-related DNA helicase